MSDSGETQRAVQRVGDAFDEAAEEAERPDTAEGPRGDHDLGEQVEGLGRRN